MKSTRPEFQMPARPAVSPRGGSKLAWSRGEFVAAAGYLLGEYRGGREFHWRMTRIVAPVAVLAAVSFALLTHSPPAP